MAVIFAGSSWPGKDIPGPVSQVSVGLHIMEYAILYLMAARTFAPARSSVSRRGLVLTALVFCILYSLSDEIHQAFVPGRNADGWDMAADAAGAIIGMAGRYWWRMVNLV